MHLIENLEFINIILVQVHLKKYAFWICLKVTRRRTQNVKNYVLKLCTIGSLKTTILIKNVDEKSLILQISPLLLINKKYASHSRWE